MYIISSVCSHVNVVLFGDVTFTVLMFVTNVTNMARALHDRIEFGRVYACYLSNFSSFEPTFLSQEKFLSQGYIFLPKSLAKGMFLTKPPKNGILGLN